MVRAILNNIPLNDIQTGIEFMKSWGGSIGTTNYSLWLRPTGECYWEGKPIGTYAEATQSGYEAVLRWFNGYSECHRDGQPLAGSELNFEVSYNTIMEHVEAAIEAHLLPGGSNPVAGIRYIKHTSTCFVWHRDPVTHQKTGCHGLNGKINMQDFCAQRPNRPNPPNDRNCRASSINPSGINATTWLQTQEGRNSNQQLGLETTVGRDYIINLGFYTPDQPIQRSDGTWTSGLGCENNCYFLMGNPNPLEKNNLMILINETELAAWIRHRARHNNTDYGYIADQAVKFVHVLRVEPAGGKTWITVAFQAN
jgi:hypothetical protein